MIAEASVLTNSLDVLIVDDSAEDRLAVRRLLHRSKSGVDFLVREAETGAQGIRMCFLNTPDCLILDYSLRDTDAINFLEELNAGRDVDNTPLCPVVILTGTGTIAEVAVAALKGGAQDYLTKETLTSEAISRAIVTAVEKVSLRRKLQDSESRFRLSLDNMPDSFGIYQAVRHPITDAVLDFECDYLNAAARQEVESAIVHISGHIPQGDLLSTHWSTEVIAEYLKLIETGEPIDSTQLDFLDNSAQLRQATHRRAWKMSDGFAVAWRDVTEQIKAEENLRDMESELTVERAKVAARQQEVSEIVQHSLLLAPLPNQFRNLTLQLFYSSASDEALVGGDFFDAFLLPNDHVALVVGDATGHGVESARFIPEAKFSLRGYLREHNGNLPVAFDLLNRFMVEYQQVDSQGYGFYVALSAAVINTSSGQASFCCAGGEPPLILRSAPGDVIVSCNFGPLLGAAHESQFAATDHILHTDDLIAITSDGITEARRYRDKSADGTKQGIKFLGLDGFATILHNEAIDARKSLPEIETAVIRRVFNPLLDVQLDDVCLLLARYE